MIKFIIKILIILCLVISILALINGNTFIEQVTGYFAKLF